MLGWMILFALMGFGFSLTGAVNEHAIALKAAGLLFSSLFAMFVLARVVRVKAR
jgi:hypothetical protein